MVAVTSGKVLITGASGYIGAWNVKYLVELGFTIVAALRSDAAGEFLVNRFPEYKGKVSYVIIKDIEADGAYDEVVKDVDAIIHSASPVVFKWDDPSEIINPAVKGAVGILKSAHKFGKQVKRVVLTSSTLSLTSAGGAPGTYDETKWNEGAPKHVEEKGRESNPWIVYAASKTLAEKAAWEFVNTNKPSFDFVAVLPTLNLGPFIHEAVTREKLGSTLGVFVSQLNSATPDTSGKFAGNWVDARDAALVHVKSLITPAAGGERVIAANGVYSWQDVFDVLNAAGYKGVPGKDSKGAGVDELVKTAHNFYDASKSLKLFPDLKYRSFQESISDLGKDFEAKGFWN